MKTICFDLDGVLCETKNGNYLNSKPKKKVINLINKLYSKGYKIIIFTARFMGRTNNNYTQAKRKAKKLTIDQLKSWNLKYHEIYFGKPSYDFFIDDKSIFFKKDWYLKFEKKVLN